MITKTTQELSVRSSQLILEYWDCDALILNDQAALDSLLQKSARAIGETAIDRVFHCFRPSGITGYLITPKAQFTIHTWPEHAYTSSDVQIACDGEYRIIEQQLRDGLRAKQSQLLEIKRGSSETQRIEAIDHRRVKSRTIDLRKSTLPKGMTLGRSPNRGLGLFASHDFSPGEIIHLPTGEQFEWDTELIIETDLGRSVHDADSFGYELDEVFVKNLPKRIRDAIAKHFELDNPTPAQTLNRITDEYRTGVVVFDYEGLMNHSNKPNTFLDWQNATLEFHQFNKPIWTVPSQVIRPIKAGEELFVDYQQTLYDFIPPSSWLA
ncbi:MAG: SET domain-containing protein-lysine N-methyltransferase [Planctomycetaceae bacterium]|nr:SET domain-containing protein-lysine N-methyltransferase [Planctomycetaceae bacterium]